MSWGPRQADAVGPVVPGVASETRQRRRYAGELPVLTVIALGGIVGAEARYAVSVWLPHRPEQWPVGTWLVNASGCFLIGVFMVVITELTEPHRLVRPFIGVGVLGGYTTFSTATVEVQQLALHGRPAVALGYLLATVVGALVAVALGTASARAVGATQVRRRARASRT